MQKRHPLQLAFNRFQDVNGFNFLGTIALDYLLYGEVYLEVATNPWGRNGIIEWLNPLGVSVFYTRRIEAFRYGWNSAFITYRPDDIAYLHNRNPENDYLGYPQVLAVLPGRPISTVNRQSCTSTSTWATRTSAK